jgi:hypothetical protein
MRHPEKKNVWASDVNGMIGLERRGLGGESRVLLEVIGI